MSTPKPAPLRDQITAFLAGREEATLKQIAAATTERDFPSRVTAELNKMRTDAVVECEKKKGKNELWCWLAAHTGAAKTIGYVVLPADSSGEITDYEADEAIFEPGGEAALDEAKRLAAQRVEDDECETAKICALIPVATAARRVVFEPA